jgi:hypothetical protein
VAITVARQALEVSFAAKISSQNCFMVEKKVSSQGGVFTEAGVARLTRSSQALTLGDKTVHGGASVKRYFCGSFSKLFLQWRLQK